ncbi:MAG TPA: OmpA family protein, partial [Burkholderiales bacterium]|nr:OmpA family protein [Burkholderiales bacterium]
MTKPFNPTRRLSAVAIAAALTALAGAASAQSGYVVDSQKNAVRSTYSECVFSGQAPAKGAVCPPTTAASSTGAAPTRVASSEPRAAAAAPAAGAAAAPSAASGSTGKPTGLPGYAVSSDGRVVLSGFGQCVRSGHWVPANAVDPCDRIAVAQVAPPPAPVAVAPEPKLEPAPPPAPIAVAPVAPPEPPRPVIQKLTLSTDVLFDFGKAELKDSGKARLDQLAGEIKDAQVDEIIAVGHADRIGSDDFNLKLSEARAQAVKDYLAGTVKNANRVTAEGKGESQPVTGDDCKKMGAERASNKKVVAC